MRNVPLQMSLGVVDHAGWLKESPRVVTKLVLSWPHHMGTERRMAHSHRTVWNTFLNNTFDNSKSCCFWPLLQVSKDTRL